jgi:hypothetical protein
LNLFFGRSYPWQTELLNKARFFVFKCSILGTVDPLTGMSIQLVDLDRFVAKVLRDNQRKIFSSEHDLLLSLKQEMLGFSQSSHRLELEDPVLLKSWGLSENGIDWQERRWWVHLREEKKMYLLRLRSSKEVALARTEFQSLADLRRQVESLGERWIEWDLREPVTGNTRGISRGG